MNKLKAQRTALNLSQSQLANKAGVSLAMIQKYEQGVKDINKAQGGTLLKIARALNCTIEELLEDEHEQGILPEPFTSFDETLVEAHRRNMIIEIRAKLEEHQRFKERMKKQQKERGNENE